MNSPKTRSFVRGCMRDWKKTGKFLCVALAFFGVLNLFFLPFIHFHPENIHTHPGENGSHQHKGHFHSHELDTIAHWANVIPEDTQSDDPLHHTHSPSDYDPDQVEYTTLALHLLDKDKVFSTTDLKVVPNQFSENYQNTTFTPHPAYLPTANRQEPVQQMRGPPSA